MDSEPRPPVTATSSNREPSFFKKGRATFMVTMKEAANYKELKRTPYGLKPIYILVILSTASAFNSGIFGAAGPEIIRDLGVDLLPLFGVFSALNFFLILAVLGLGYVADRVKRTPLVGIGAIIAGLSSLFVSRAQGLYGLGIPLSGANIGEIAVGVPTASLQADYYPPEVRGKAFALLNVLIRVTQLTVPLLLVGIIGRFGWRLPYYVTGPVVIAAGLLVLFSLKEPIRGYMERRALGASEEVARVPEEPPSFGEAWRTIWSIRTIRRLFIASIPGNAGSTIFAFFYTVFLFERYQLDLNERAILGTAIAIFTLPFGFMAGGIIDVLLRRRPERVLIFSGILGLLSAFALIPQIFGPPLWVVILFAMLFGGLGALLGPASNVLFLQILPAHVRTLGGSVFALAQIPATIFRVLFVGFAFSQWGLQGALGAAVPFIILEALISLSAASFYPSDLRSALNSQLASQEWREAKESGKGKLLVCREVDVEYDGVQVLFGVDFDVEEQEIIALLGTNGAGKSTLLRAISGTQEASGGAIVFDGRDITHMPTHEITRRGVIHIPGGRGTFPGLTVRENLLLVQGGDGTDEEAQLRKIYDMFPVLEERASTRAGALSGGEQQMLSLAQAFLSKPRLLMIDELSLGLSPAVVEQLIQAVRLIHAEGTTVILVEQSVNVALTVAEKAVFMEKGEVKFIGKTRDLLTRPDILRAVYVKGSGALSAGAPAGALDSAERKRRQYELEDKGSLLEVRNVSKSFGGVKALDDVSFDLKEGEILGLIGPNGAGKTTLFDVMTGYQVPDSGSVLLEGLDVSNMRPDQRAKKKMIRRFQDARLFPSLTVYENLLIALERKLEVRSVLLNAVQVPQARKSERAARRRADHLIDLLELGSYRDKFVKELSTGLRRIVDIACVLATEPKLLLLDEPSSGIAQAESESLGPLLRRVRFETGSSMLIIEHDINLISTVSDELLAMDQGRVVLRGLPDEVLNDERVIQSYLGTTEEVIQRSGLLT